ncbi:MAG TPA: PaaI family thioesterase [Burkholderiaceae bacterium]
MNSPAPADPGFRQRVHDSFARQGVMHTLGATLEVADPGRVVIVMAHKPELTQQHGFVHAGIVSTALDSACGYAAFSLMAADAAVLTIEFKVNLLAPARGPWFRFEGQVVKGGRTISVVEGKAWQHEAGGAETLCATMTATVMTVQGRGLTH